MSKTRKPAGSPAFTLTADALMTFHFLARQFLTPPLLAQDRTSVMFAEDEGEECPGCGGDTYDTVVILHFDDPSGLRVEVDTGDEQLERVVLGWCVQHGIAFTHIRQQAASDEAAADPPEPVRH